MRLLRSFDPATAPGGQDVPDPYAGGPEGFLEVLDQVEAASAGVVEHLRQLLASRNP